MNDFTYDELMLIGECIIERQYQISEAGRILNNSTMIQPMFKKLRDLNTKVCNLAVRIKEKE